MRNLKPPSLLKKKKTDERIFFRHRCDGLVGLNAQYAFSTKGLLKVINRDVDKDARGFYEKGYFYIESQYDRDELLALLTKSYTPAPFIPIWSKFLFSASYMEKLDRAKDQHPHYYKKVLRAKIGIEKWLEENGFEVEDIKGDVLINLFHDAEKIIEDKDVIDYLKTAGVPYTIQSGHNTYKKLWFSPLFNKSLGRYGNGNIFNSYLSSILEVTRESWEATIFGTPHQVIGKYPAYQYDLKNWGGQMEGKVDVRRRSRGVGTSSGETSLGTPADTILAIESLTFFRGFVGERFRQGTDDAPEVDKTPLFTLLIRNNAPGFSTGLWSEMSMAKQTKHLLGVEELFVPLWDTPMTFDEARGRLARTAELPVQTYLNTSRDLMKHLSLHAKQTGISSYARFSVVGRGGVGMSQLHFLIPIEEFYPQKSRRNDIISPMMRLYNECLFKVGRNELPVHLNGAVSGFVSSITDFTMSRSTTKEIMYALLEMIRRIRITSVNAGGRLSREHFDVNADECFSLPEWWLEVLERGYESSEMRIAKSIVYGIQMCYLEDIRDLLEDKLDNRLVEAYIDFLPYIQTDKAVRGVDSSHIWMPMDYVISYFFLYHKRGDMRNERSAWSFLLNNDDTASALAVATDSLYSNNVMKDVVVPFDSTKKENLLLAVKIPIGKSDKRRLRRML